MRRYIQIKVLPFTFAEACRLEQDQKREFGNLEKINDNYPKYVISGDLMDLSRNGIIHKNIINFLLG